MNAAKIVIIDDENDICYLLENSLRKFDFKVYSFNTLMQGINKLPELRPYLVFLDINLPDGNGLDALPEIKKAIPHSRIILMSAYDSPVEKTKAIREGAEEFVSKPFRPIRSSAFFQRD